jgi:hypothetical protein
MNDKRTSSDNAQVRLAGTTLLVSAAVAVVAIAFLVAMFASFSAGAQADGERYGWINDVLVIVQYVLIAPAIVAVQRLSHDRSPTFGTAILVSGLTLIALIALGQGLLVAGVMTFEEQTVPLSIMFVLLAAWFVAVGRLVTSLGIARRGVAMGLLAATYIGYPIWAVWLGRAFRGRAATDGPAVSPDLEARPL